MPLEEIRKLFESAESEPDPERKLACLEEALDLSDDFLTDDPSTSHARIIRNVRQSHLRRLIVQLADMRNIDIAIWFNYLKLFIFRVKPEVQAILDSDDSLASSYRSFWALWRDEFLAVAEAYGEER